MNVMTPEQARAARAMLNLDMKSVCKLAEVGKRTLTEFESGHRSINDATRYKIQAFYISQGIGFSDSSESRQTVTLTHLNTNGPESIDIVSEKREYVDYLDTFKFDLALLAVKDTIESVGTDVSFSRKTLNEIMNRNNINQKELASILGCSAAFVSAMIIGKKHISPPMAEKLNALFENFEINIKRTTDVERTLSVDLSSILRLTDAARMKLSTIYRR